jgi:hypothetical protein
MFPASGPGNGQDHPSTSLEKILSRFESAWQRGPQPPLEEFLPPDGPFRRAVLVELLYADLECRRKSGQGGCVEDYLQRYPELTADREAVLGLIAREYDLRRRDDLGLFPEEYLERFPDYGEEMLARLRVVAAREATAPGGPEPPDGSVPPEQVFPVIPGYEIRTELGRGAMGVVYEARQTRANRPVALKMILADSQAGPAELRRFQLEAEAVACLQHPNIIQIYEVGEVGGRPFFSLELCREGSLAARLNGPLRPRQAAELTRTLARAVHAAHQQGIVHRDLKPANVLLAADGTPKLTDFGLAKRLDVDVGQTHSGAILGTPSYMAPEQALGKTGHIGPAADIYALGAILYELLTGQPPFRAATMLDTLTQVVSQEPVAPRRRQPTVPRDLETVCLKCLAKDPQRRYATAQELAEDVGRFLEDRPVRARRATPPERLWRWCRRNPLPAGLLLAVTLSAALGLAQLARLSDHLVRSSALEGAAQQADMLEQVNDHYSDIVDGVRRQGFAVGDERTAGPGAVPVELPAQFTINLGRRLGEQGQTGVRLRLFSDYPFRSRTDGRPRDDFEREALRQLRQDPGQPFHRFEDFEGRPVVRYAVTRRMRSSCVHCHNTHPGSTKRDWRVGDVRGVVEIIRPLDGDVSRVRAGLRGTSVVVAVSSVALLGLSLLVLAAGRRRRGATAGG